MEEPEWQPPNAYHRFCLSHLLSILGERPPTEVIRGSGLWCTWLVQTFSHPREGVDEGTISRYAKAYLLYLIEAVLFADKTSSQI